MSDCLSGRRWGCSETQKALDVRERARCLRLYSHSVASGKSPPVSVLPWEPGGGAELPGRNKLANGPKGPNSGSQHKAPISKGCAHLGAGLTVVDQKCCSISWGPGHMASPQGLGAWLKQGKGLSLGPRHCQLSPGMQLPLSWNATPWVAQPEECTGDILLK